MAIAANPNKLLKEEVGEEDILRSALGEEELFAFSVLHEYRLRPVQSNGISSNFLYFRQPLCLERRHYRGLPGRADS
jgi:hypothetical protein